MEKLVALVVDDDPALRKMVVVLLKSWGFEPLEAPDGRTATRLLDEKKPGVVCLDIMLPEASGYDVLEYLRKSPELSATPVVVMSARGLPEDKATAEELGAGAYLVKPFTSAELKAGLARALGRPVEVVP